MTQVARWLERRLVNEAGPRDGEFTAFEEVALANAPVLPPEPAKPAVVRRERESLRREPILLALAEKVLAAHIQNRLQVSYPLTVNLANTAPDEIERLMAIAAIAALAGDEAARGREASADLEALSASPAARTRFEALLAAPPPLAEAMAALVEARLGAHAYAVCLVVLARPSPDEAAFLAYLAARLRLGQDVVDGLTRRYRR